MVSVLFLAGLYGCGAQEDALYPEALEGDGAESDGLEWVNVSQDPLVMECEAATVSKKTDEPLVLHATYYPKVLNKRLNDRPELVEYTGISLVRTCDDARLVIEATNELSASEAIFDDFIKDRDLGKEPLPQEEVGVPKVRDGAPVRDHRVPMIVSPMLNNPGYSLVCSSVAISPNHLLTAAHCVSGVQRNEFVSIDISLAGANGIQQSLDSWVVRVYSNENWGGSGDHGDDYALIEVYERASLHNDTRWYHDEVMDVWLGDIFAFKPLSVLGWGFARPFDLDAHPEDRWGTLRKSDDAYVHSLGVDMLASNTGVALCEGDSGGPAFLQTRYGDKVVGLASALWWPETRANENGVEETGMCVESDGPRFWARMNRNFTNWVEPKMRLHPWYNCTSDTGPCCVREGGHVPGMGIQRWARCKTNSARPNPYVHLNDVVGFFNRSHSRFLVSNPNRHSLDASAFLFGPWEEYRVLDDVGLTGHGQDRRLRYGDVISLRTRWGRYVVAEQNGDANANRTGVGAWERFEVVSPDGRRGLVECNSKVALKSTAFNRYLQAHPNGHAYSDPVRLGPWETFDVKCKDR